MTTPPPPPPPVAGLVHSAPAFDLESIDSGSVVSFQQGGTPAQIPGGGFTLPKLTSLTDKVVYDVWKNAIRYFQLGDHPHNVIQPITNQFLQDDVAQLAATLGPNLILHERTAGLDESLGIVSDKDTLIKELYSIQQGPKESVNCYATRIGYAMIKLTATLLNAVSLERSDEMKKSNILGGLRAPLKAALACKLSLDWQGKEYSLPRPKAGILKRRAEG